MKAWMVGAVWLAFACIAALASSPVFTGTWIVRNSTVGMVHAIVFTVGIAERGLIFRLREVSAWREDRQLYAAIHDAARISQPDGASMDDPFKENRHWGGGQSWCNGEDCQRFYIFVGSSLKPVPGTPPSAICQLPNPSIAKDSRGI
jgi:predicted acyl esterase